MRDRVRKSETTMVRRVRPAVKIMIIKSCKLQKEITVKDEK